MVVEGGIIFCGPVGGRRRVGGWGAGGGGLIRTMIRILDMDGIM